MNTQSPSSTWNGLKRFACHARRVEHRWIWLLIILMALILVLVVPVHGTAVASGVT